MKYEESQTVTQSEKKKISITWGNACREGLWWAEGVRS